MSRTRGKGEGSIYQRADGYWVGQVELGRCPGGHTRKDGSLCPGGERRRSRTVRRYRQEVVDTIGDLRVKGASAVLGQRWRVNDYLDFWLTDVIPGEVTDSSLAEYTKRLARCRPSLGGLWLDKITKPHVQRLANELTERYAPKTRTTTLATLRQALEWAVPEHLARNPAEKIQGLKRRVARIDDTLETDEAKAVETEAEGDRYEALYWLALNYGLRIGELLGLDWDAITVGDWDADIADGDEISVRKSKTPAGIRTLPLIPDAKTQLAMHRRRTIAAGRLPAGPVFIGPEGGNLKAQRLRAWYSDLLERAEVKHLCRNCGTGQRCSSNIRRFHSSRHTAATLLIEKGVPLNVVSVILGHANLQITHDLYAKVRADLLRKGLSQIG